jgi:RNA polymerase-binding protein DksA
MEGTGLKKKDLKRFRDILLTRKKDILRNAQRTLSEDMTLESDDLPDEMDLASSEYLQSFTFRLRGREKTFLQKIDHALEKIEEGTFGRRVDFPQAVGGSTRNHAVHPLQRGPGAHREGLRVAGVGRAQERPADRPRSS